MFPAFAAQPRQLLNYLEWTLLGILFMAEWIGATNFGIPRHPDLNLACVTALAGLGFVLPHQSRLRIRVLFSLVELGLIVLAVQVGGIRLVPLLFVVFFVRNAMLFERRTRHGFAIAAFGLYVWLQYYRIQFLPQLIPPAWVSRIQPMVFSLVLLLGLVLFFLQLLMDAWLSDYRSRCRLEAANAQLRQYALRIEDIATLQERNRIAREIHDALGHSLTVLNLNLQAAHKLWVVDADQAHTLLEESKRLSIQALDSVRESVKTLRADPLHAEGIEATLAPLLESFQRSTGLTPTLQIELGDALSRDIELAIYRIVQEALTNIAKYAQASAVGLTLTRPNPQTLALEITDNGKGFDPSQNTTGFGLQGMRERTIALKGQLQVTSADGQGCRIEALIPLPLTASTL